MILAAFRTEDALREAETRVRPLGQVETYMSSEPDAPDGTSPIPLVILLAGVLGTLGSFLVQSYATTLGYPLDIGGHPNFSWPSYVPTAFENGVLVAVIAGFAAFLIVNRLPRLYAPIDESEAFRNASRDGYFLTVRTEDAPRAHIERVQAVLAECGAELVQELAE